MKPKKVNSIFILHISYIVLRDGEKRPLVFQIYRKIFITSCSADGYKVLGAILKMSIFSCIFVKIRKNAHLLTKTESGYLSGLSINEKNIDTRH